MWFIIFYPLYLTIFELGIFVFPKFWLIFLFLLVIISTIECFLLTHKKIVSFYFLGLSFFSLSILIISFLLIFFIQSIIFIQYLIFLILSFKLFLSYVYKTRNKAQFLFQNFVSLINIIIFFLFTSLLYYINLLGNLKFWYLVIFFLFFIFLLISLSFKIYEIQILRKINLILILILILTEGFWVMTFLPFDIFVLSGILTVLYYYLFGLARHFLYLGEKSLTKKIIIRYSIISAIGITSFMILSLI